MTPQFKVGDNVIFVVTNKDGECISDYTVEVIRVIVDDRFVHYTVKMDDGSLIDHVLEPYLIRIH